MEVFTRTEEDVEKLIDKSIILDNEKQEDDNSEKKKTFLKNSMSEDYILQYIREEMPFTRAVIRGLEEHIEDLMTRLYHYENYETGEDTQSDTQSDMDKKSVESDLSIQSVEIIT